MATGTSGLIAFVVMRGTTVHSVYTEDPSLNPDAEPRAELASGRIAISGQDEQQTASLEGAVWVARVPLNPVL